MKNEFKKYYYYYFFLGGGGGGVPGGGGGRVWGVNVDVKEELKFL